MRTVCLTVALAISATAAASQTFAQTAAKRPSHDAGLVDEKARVAECVKLWDRSTHMTKQEWDATCRRVARERIEQLHEQGYGTERKKPAKRNKSSQM